MVLLAVGGVPREPGRAVGETRRSSPWVPSPKFGRSSGENNIFRHGYPNIVNEPRASMASAGGVFPVFELRTERSATSLSESAPGQASRRGTRNVPGQSQAHGVCRAHGMCLSNLRAQTQTKVCLAKVAVAKFAEASHTQCASHAMCLANLAHDLRAWPISGPGVEASHTECAWPISAHGMCLTECAWPISGGLAKAARASCLTICSDSWWLGFPNPIFWMGISR